VLRLARFRKILAGQAPHPGLRLQAGVQGVRVEPSLDTGERRSCGERAVPGCRRPK
jgi:hypothetical protein